MSKKAKKSKAKAEEVEVSGARGCGSDGTGGGVSGGEGFGSTSLQVLEGGVCAQGYAESGEDRGADWITEGWRNFPKVHRAIGGANFHRPQFRIDPKHSNMIWRLRRVAEAAYQLAGCDDESMSWVWVKELHAALEDLYE